MQLLHTAHLITKGIYWPSNVSDKKTKQTLAWYSMMRSAVGRSLSSSYPRWGVSTSQAWWAEVWFSKYWFPCPHLLCQGSGPHYPLRNSCSQLLCLWHLFLSVHTLCGWLFLQHVNFIWHEALTPLLAKKDLALSSQKAIWWPYSWRLPPTRFQHIHSPTEERTNWR